MKSRWLILLLLAAVGLSGCSTGPGERISKAEKYLRAGKDALAAKEISAAVKEADDKLRTAVTAAAVYGRYSRFAAQERLLRDITDDPVKLVGRKLQKWERISLYDFLAESQYKQGKIRESAGTLELAYKLAPDDPMLKNNLAYRYAEADEQLSKALVLAKDAYKALPQDSNVIDTLGWVYYKLGEYQTAERYLYEAVKRNKGSAELRYHLGAAYLKLGKLDEAKIELEKALIIKSTMTEARKELRKLSKKG